MRYLIGIIIAAIAVALPFYWAFAHSWYSQQCCSGLDCEPLPIDGVEEVQGGWRVHYVSPKFGPIEQFVPRSLMRDSQDGRFHGCFRMNDHLPICFYVPSNT